MEKTTPNSVCCPVATTIPSPRPGSIVRGAALPQSSVHSPFRTRVPMNPMLVLSPRGAPGTHALESFLTACASPVRDDSSTSRSSACNSRTSAGTRSPTVNETISPGRSSLARTVVCCPSLLCRGSTQEFKVISETESTHRRR